MKEITQKYNIDDLESYLYKEYWHLNKTCMQYKFDIK